MAPQVTVVIPTRNRRPLLQLALDCARGQEGVTVEVVVVDEASTDDTPAFLAALDDARVSVIRHEEPQGVSRARNAGIAAARGTYVAFLDDDDVWAPQKLAHQIRAMEAASASWSYAGVMFVDDRYRPLVWLPAFEEPAFRTRILETYLVHAGGSNVIASRAALDAVGGFDAGFMHNADWDMWIRLGQYGLPAVAPEIVVGYVRHRNMVSRDATGKYEDLARLREKHAAARVELGAATNEAESLDWIGTSSVWAGDTKAARAAFTAAARLDRSPKAWAKAVLCAVPGYLAALDAYQRRKLPRSARDQVGWLAPYQGRIVR
jgi:glycosyltransferase involved in cell wall biosynthesis